MKKLIFIYNADSGFFNSLKDTVQKTVAPKSYDCKLCQVTFGAFSMKDDWREFINQLSIKVEFLHKDEFIKKYGKTKHNFPNAFIEENKKLTLFISSQEINSTKDIAELKALVEKKIKTIKVQ